jgi:hypothetical protein
MQTTNNLNKNKIENREFISRSQIGLLSVSFSFFAAILLSLSAQAEDQMQLEAVPEFKVTTNSGSGLGFLTNIATNDSHLPHTYGDLGILEGTVGYSASHSSSAGTQPWKMNLGLAIQNVLRSNGVDPDQLITQDVEWKFLDSKLSLELAPKEGGNVGVEQYRVTINPVDVTFLDRTMFFNLGQIEISKRTELDGTFQVTTYPIRYGIHFNRIQSAFDAVRETGMPFELSFAIGMFGYTFIDQPQIQGSAVALADLDISIGKSWVLKDNQGLRLSGQFNVSGHFASDTYINHQEFVAALTYSPLKNLSLRLYFKTEADQLGRENGSALDDIDRSSQTQTGGLELISTY